MTLERDVAAEATKLVRRFEDYARQMRDDDARRTRRTGVPHQADLHRPSYWTTHRAFDPYKVRASSRSIARAVELSLRHRDYRPLNPVAYEVEKADGSTRVVSVFSIADATVSRRIYRSLLEKNTSRFSSYSYAYRNDVTAHDAIQHIGAELSGRGRTFLAEYDFSKYFDRISHAYIWRVLHEQKFLVSPLERHVLETLLQTSLQEQHAYSPFGRKEQRTTGLPQGTSVSLFLANVAAWELDRALERLGVGFARYADDTLIWSHDYARICEAVEALT